MEYTKVFFASLPFLFTLPFFWFHFCRNKNGQRPSTLPRDWPVFGMIPSLLFNLHRLVDFSVDVMQQSRGTFMIKGPCLTKMELLATADPDNVQYIISKHHNRFNRGPNFEEIFDILGDGIFNSDHEKWRYQRKIALAYFTDMGFRRFMAKNISYKIESGLIPLLERSFVDGSIIDLQDIFQRFAGDITWMLLIGYDPHFLSSESDHPSPIHAIRGLTGEAEEVVITRHALPSCIWKMLRYYRIGKERKHMELATTIDSFIYGFIRSKRDDMIKGRKGSPNNRDAMG